MSVSHCGVDEATCHTSSKCGWFGEDGCVCNDPPGCTFPYPPPCTPNWQCEQPLNCYENDGCGNRQQNSSCCPATTHKECVNGSCISLPGAGTDLCSANSECKHKECKTTLTGTFCMPVPGKGPDLCTENSCSPTHMECINQKCTSVAGEGTNQCQSDTQCKDIVDPIDWQQYIVPGLILTIGVVLAYYYTKRR